MIILDTNVLSEPLRPAPNARVIAWMSTQTDAAVTAISIAELLSGGRRLPEGRRRAALLRSIDGILAAGPVLAFGTDEARVYARLQEIRRVSGRPLSVEDGMIAAIAAVHGVPLATRNTADFELLGIRLIDPWNDGTNDLSARDTAPGDG